MDVPLRRRQLRRECDAESGNEPCNRALHISLHRETSGAAAVGTSGVAARMIVSVIGDVNDVGLLSAD